jgi:hypothetical protein
MDYPMRTIHFPKSYPEQLIMMKQRGTQFLPVFMHTKKFILQKVSIIQGESNNKILSGGL